MKAVEEAPLVWNIDGYDLHINHPKKIYWPGEGYTKLDLLNYYKSIAPTMLPYFKNRPVTMRFFPRGIDDFSFYKRNFNGETGHNNMFKTMPYEEVSQDKTIEVPIIETSAGLLWLASKGGLEFHLWSSKMPNYWFPDMVIFDLDIDKSIPFKNVLKAASYLKELLDSLNLKSFPKTTGGNGLHAYVPIVSQYSFKFVREWAKRVGEKLANTYPDLITIKRKERKTHKSKKVTIDYLQNVISRNTAAPYTVRAYKKAPVSTPLTWNEVKKGGFKPTDFNIKNGIERVEKLGDVFNEVLTLKQFLPNKKL